MFRHRSGGNSTHTITVPPGKARTPLLIRRFLIHVLVAPPFTAISIVTKIVRRVYGENSLTNRIMENDALFTNIQERRNTGKRKNTAFAQFSNTSKQQITNNNRNSTNNNAQRLAADQLAMRTRLQRDSSRFEDVPRRILLPNIYSVPDRA
ncbi:hypothetical protein AVEN_225277-1 [Araneus ventricosus]|uniref:Uncharacterized protein n=1 Tax=Araneus ventricosus TaxID=182803 RepID=A0A4Y2ALA5_ARAVE|nr:hypothetical protein AVEN_225277-1 [Araneus ventricosus]